MVAGLDCYGASHVDEISVGKIIKAYRITPVEHYSALLFCPSIVQALEKIIIMINNILSRLRNFSKNNS